MASLSLGVFTGECGMSKTTLLWTALPGGITRLAGAAEARVSVFVSARLEPDAAESTLADFPALVDWPKTLNEWGPNGIEFELQVRDDEGQMASVTVKPRFDGSDIPDSLAWRSIFPSTLTVESVELPPEPKRGTNDEMRTYSSSGVVAAVRDVYAKALAKELAVDSTPPSWDQFNVAQSRLDAPLAINANPIEAFASFHQPPAGALEAPRRSANACPDFHQLLAAIGSHPQLLRRLGVVIELVVPVGDLRLEEGGENLRLRAVPLAARLDTTQHHAFWTQLQLGSSTTEGYQVFRAGGDSRLGGQGLLAIDSSDTTLVQENLEHATFGLIQQARLAAAEQKPDDASLPALLQGGMRLTHATKPPLLELAIRDQSRLEQALKTAQLNTELDRLGAAETDEILYAEHLNRGYRVDVQDVDVGIWRSLCEREVRYEAGDWEWPAEGSMQDEGSVGPTVAREPDATGFSAPRVTDDLFEWDGWSLAVPRPNDAASISDEPDAQCEVTLKSSLAVPPGSLTPQRFGRRYRFRLRNVDLAGNSLSAAQADHLHDEAPDAVEVTSPHCYLRVESVKPPLVMRAQPRGPGEGGDVIVIRDAEQARFRTPEFRVHLAPPEVPLRLAEKHGVFDRLTDDESWRMLSQHRGSPDTDETGELLEFVASSEFFTSYLPDPLLRQAVLCLPRGGTTIDLPRFDALPAGLATRELARSCQLIIRAGSGPVTASKKGRAVTLSIPRGRIQEIKLAAKLGPEELKVLALAQPDWCANEAMRSSVAQTKLAEAAACGAAPLLAPAKTLTIIHASQRPLRPPAFGRPFILPRAENESSARLGDDALDFDLESTGRIDVYANWQEPFDDPAEEGWQFVNNEIYAGGVSIDQANDKPFDPLGLQGSPRSPLTHGFADTKHRVVSYKAVATSRFAEFYPAELTDDADNVSLSSKPVELSIPSTAPPAAPEIAYVLPTFRQTKSFALSSIDEHERQAEKQGDGLRIYLERGWFSSGAGEQLAVVVATDPFVSEQLQAKVSEWGTNPLHDSAPLPEPLQMKHVWGGQRRIRNWSLAGENVGLVVHDVHFSVEHRRPFIDIEFLSQRAFMPLVRLALARYQANSIARCELSPVVHADFVPLAPGRALTVSKQSSADWSLTLQGYSYRQDDESTDYHQTSVVEVEVEVMPSAVPDDVAAWRGLGDAVILEASSLEPWLFQWRGAISITDQQYLSSRHWRRRLVVREFEPFNVDSTQNLEDRSRLVSAHVVPI